MQALPLEQKPWAYARQTVAEAGSCLCRYLQSFFEHSPCKAAQHWQVSRFLSVPDVHTIVFDAKRALHDALQIVLVCTLWCNDVQMRGTEFVWQEGTRPLTLMTDLQMEIAKRHDIWAGCMLERAILCGA